MEESGVTWLLRGCRNRIALGDASTGLNLEDLFAELGFSVQANHIFSPDGETCCVVIMGDVPALFRMKPRAGELRVMLDCSYDDPRLGLLHQRLTFFFEAENGTHRFEVPMGRPAEPAIPLRAQRRKVG